MGNFLDSSGLTRVWNKISQTYLSKGGGTMTGSTTFNSGCWKLAASEANEISHTNSSQALWKADHSEKVTTGTVPYITNAIRFRWYDDYWDIGILRSDGTPSAGFVIGLEYQANEILDYFRIDKNGNGYIKGNTIYTTANFSPSNHNLYHTGNANRSDTTWAASTLYSTTHVFYGKQNVSYTTTVDNWNQYGILISYGNGKNGVYFCQDGNTRFYGNIIKDGGTSSQFLKADGSVDSNAYITGITSSMVTTALGYTPANSSSIGSIASYGSGDYYRLITHSAMSGDIPSDLANGVHVIHRPGIEYSTIFSFRDYSGSVAQLYFHPNASYTESIYYRKGSGAWKTLAFTDSTVSRATVANYVDGTDTGNWDANSPTKQYLWYYGQSGGVSNIPDSYGSIVTFASNGMNTGLNGQLGWSINHSQDAAGCCRSFWWRAKNDIGWGNWVRVYDAKYHPSADNAGYADSAGSIPSHTLWGNSFNGTQNLGGDITFWGKPNVSYETTLANQQEYGLRVKFSNGNNGPLFHQAGHIIVPGNVEASGNITATGAITAGSASDKRLKENIQLLNKDKAKSIILNSRPVEFTWSSEATSLYDKLAGNDIGLVAQEIEPYLPQAIGEIFNKYKRLDYTKLITPLISVVQDHEESITDLKERVRTLEKENKELKEKLK